MSQWIDDDKSVYVREDLAFNLIRYNNLGVIKAEKNVEFQTINQFEEKGT